MTLRAAMVGVLLLALAGCSGDGRAEPGGTTPASAPALTSASASSSAPAPAPASSSAPDSAALTPAAAPSVTSPPGCDWLPCYVTPGDSVEIVGATPEASGVAASSSDPDLFFVVDDGTGVSSIAAVRLDGSTVGQIEVAGMSARNAEALAAGICDAGSPARCLYVGDIGGNAGRQSVDIYRIPEPDPTALPAAVPADAWTYDYPDGTYNAEALLIGDDGSVIVITKPDEGIAAHRVYAGAPGGGTLTLTSTFTPPTPKNPVQSSMVGNVVTDADRREDRVLLLTYDQAVEYLAPTPGADPAQFPTWPSRQVVIPAQWQSEGVAFRNDPGCGFVVVSEKSPFDGPVIGAVGCE